MLATAANSFVSPLQAVPVELAARGYKGQLCVDFSSIVVNLMKDKHAEHGITWRCMDVRDMQGVEDASVDVAFDKGTLDAMIHGSPWNPPQDVRDNTSAYLREVCNTGSRVYLVPIH